MFKFIKKYAETMDHIEIYPIISLIIFFAFFMGVLWFVKTMNNLMWWGIQGIAFMALAVFIFSPQFLFRSSNSGVNPDA